MAQRGAASELQVLPHLMRFKGTFCLCFRLHSAKWQTTSWIWAKDSSLHTLLGLTSYSLDSASIHKKHSHKHITPPSQATFKTLICSYVVPYSFVINLPQTFVLREGIFFLLALPLNGRTQHMQYCGSSSATNVPICCINMRVTLNEAQRQTVVNNNTIEGPMKYSLITENCFAKPLCMHCIHLLSLLLSAYVHFPSIALRFSANIEIFVQSEHRHHLSITPWPVRRHTGLVRNWATVLSSSGSWKCVALRDGKERQYAAECCGSSCELRTTFSHAVTHHQPSLFGPRRRINGADVEVRYLAWAFVGLPCLRVAGRAAAAEARK